MLMLDSSFFIPAVVIDNGVMLLVLGPSGIGTGHVVSSIVNTDLNCSLSSSAFCCGWICEAP